MNPANRSYLYRRLKTVRFEDLAQRMRLWNKHRSDRRILRLDRQAFSLDRIYEEKNRWVDLRPGTHLTEEITRIIEASAPKGWLQDSSFWEVFVTCYPNEAGKLLEMANAVTANRFTLFQRHEFQMSSPVRWSATLEPGRPEQEWPDDYYADIDFYHDEQRSDLDVKWCWELNRFQHLLCLGAAWRISGKECYALKAREHLESWMAQVVYPRGVQWSSNLEVGLRALSWARCHLLCLNSRSWDKGFLNRFITCLYLHASHLERELTVHHTSGNHLLGEASALFQLSILYPVFTESSRWLDRSVGIIDHLAPRLIYADGVYAEQSTGYFRFISEFLLSVLHLARYHEIDLSKVVLDRLARGFSFIEAISRDAKEVPMIGDSDTGSAIGWGLSDYWDFSPLASVARLLLNGPRVHQGSETFPAESFLISGLDGLESFENHKASRAQAVPVSENLENSWDVVTFPLGGYHVSSDNSFIVIFDAGPLGISPGFGHGHADGLSFQINFHGKQVITDTGTMLYNGDASWRRYFRGTASHNTLAVDGKDQSEPLGTFRWSKPLNIKLFEPTYGNSWGLLRGKLNLGTVECERSLLHVRENAVVVMDTITGPAMHRLEWFLHFLPDWTVEQNTGNLFHAFAELDCLEVLFLGFDSGQASVLGESLDPMGGWYSRYYGAVEATSCIKAQMVSALPVSTVIVIKPVERSLVLPDDIPRGVFTGQTLSWLSSDAFLRFCQPRH